MAIQNKIGGFPRIRGDVPMIAAGDAAKAAVFPAYAGMFRCRVRYLDRRRSFPRIRGDVPPGKAWA